MTSADAQAIGWLDWTLLAVLGVSVLIGLWRGLVLELMALAGWVVAYFGAHWAVPHIQPWVPIGQPDSSLRFVAALALAFVVILLCWKILSHLVGKLIKATPLSGLDRLLGGSFGAFRGLLILLVVATLVSATPAAKSQVWSQSIGAGWLAAVLQGIKPLLPPAAQAFVPA